jgi:hypothetical protein
MKILRAVTRRGFSVGTAGYFSVLKSSTWFPASRLPSTPYHLGDRYIGTAEPGSRHPASSPQILAPAVRDHRFMRPALVVLAAVAIAWTLLWWMIES